MTVCRLRGSVRRDELAGVCERFGAMVDEYVPPLIVCEVGALEPLDLATVDALARIQLVARRRGSAIKLWRASPDLVGLLELVGLSGRVPVWDA